MHCRWFSKCKHCFFSFILTGNIRSALDLTNELLELAPNHERASGNKLFYEKELALEAEQKADKMLRGDDGSPGLEVDPTNTETVDGAYTSYERQMYEKLCRGEIGPDADILAQLKCRYVANSPFLKIAPLKLEQASLKPNLVVFHDVIYDNEIDVIHKLSKPRVNRWSN